MFFSTDLERAFRDIGAWAFPRGKVLELGIYGRAALALGSNFHAATDVVDAIAYAEQGVVAGVAAQLARQRGWPPDWFSGRVQKYLSPRCKGLKRHHILFGTYPAEEWPGLRIHLPTAEYLLAMEIMAICIDGTARWPAGEDLRQLAAVVGITNQEELVGYVGAFYPEARGSARLAQAVERIWSAPAAAGDGGERGAARYLGRAFSADGISPRESGGH